MTTPTQSEIEELARACGWEYYEESDGAGYWARFDKYDRDITSKDCPNLFEPGPEHERMVRECLIQGEWTGTGYAAVTAISGAFKYQTALCGRHLERPIAEGYAVLAYVRWRDGDGSD